MNSSHIRHEQIQVYIQFIRSPNGAINGSQHLRKMSKNPLYHCRNKMIMHTAVEELRTVDPYIINCTIWEYIPDLDHRVEELSASGVVLETDSLST